MLLPMFRMFGSSIKATLPFSMTASLIMLSKHSGVTNSRPGHFDATIRGKVKLQAVLLYQQIDYFHHITVSQLVQSRSVLHRHELLL
jgi:hypothetical protein